jgi:hypothetical protein
MSRKTDREIVTHDELVKLYRECKQAKCGPSNLVNACKCRLESKFKTAIAEARSMGVLTLDLLIDLRKLVDPESNESICPTTLQKHLDRSIAHFMAVERKQLRPRQRATEAEA